MTSASKKFTNITACNLVTINTNGHNLAAKYFDDFNEYAAFKSVVHNVQCSNCFLNIK